MGTKDNTARIRFQRFMEGILYPNITSASYSCNTNIALILRFNTLFTVLVLNTRYTIL